MSGLCQYLNYRMQRKIAYFSIDQYFCSFNIKCDKILSNFCIFFFYIIVDINVIMCHFLSPLFLCSSVFFYCLVELIHIILFLFRIWMFCICYTLESLKQINDWSMYVQVWVGCLNVIALSDPVFEENILSHYRLSYLKELA